MDNKKIIESVNATIKPIVEKLGYEIVEISYAHSNGQNNLTVFIDAEHDIGLSDCEKVHYAIDPILDELNPTGDIAYNLNVSSSGLDRPFATMRDYTRNIGKKVEVKLFVAIDKSKTLEAKLIAYSEGVATFERIKDKKIYELAENQIAKCSKLIEFK